MTSLRETRAGQAVGVWLAAAVLVSLGAIVSVTFRHFTYDDAFITYRYASNLATGHGFVFNPGERYLGTTAPLYGLLLALLGRTRPEAIPQIGGAVSGLSLTLTGLALLRLGRLGGQTWGGFLAGAFYEVNHLAATSFGGEMTFQVMLIAWAFVLYRRDRTLAATVLLVAAVLTRPDALAAVVTLAAYAWFVRRRRLWREGRLFLLLALPFLAASWAYYGTLMPGTLAAKTAQVQSGAFPSFWDGVASWPRNVADQVPWGLGFVCLVAVGLPFVVRLGGRLGTAGGRTALVLRLALRRRFGFWALPLAWVAVCAICYALLGVPAYFWYLVPLSLGACVLAGTAAAGLTGLAAAGLARHGPISVRPWAAGFSSALALALLIRPLAAQLTYGRAFVRASRTRSAGAAMNVPDVFLREPLYRTVGLWLRDHTPPDARVGYLEIGYLGYYSQRRIVDPLGLVNPGVAPHVARGDFGWSFRTYRPDYVLDCPDFNYVDADVLASPWFRQQYAPAGQLTVDGYAPVTLYRLLARP